MPGTRGENKVEKIVDICKSCMYDEPGYCSVIGTIPHCCERHWHCRPGAEARDYKPKEPDDHAEYPADQR